MSRLVLGVLLAVAFLLLAAGRSAGRRPAVHRLDGAAARPDDASTTRRARTTARPAGRAASTPSSARCSGASIRWRDSCDHDSIFALSYLRTTEEYRRTIEDPDVLRGHRGSSTTRTPCSPACTSTPSTPGTRAGASDVPRGVGDRVPGRRRPRGDRAGQPLAGHQRPRPARPAVRARRHRAREARRIEPQDRSRPRQHLPQPRHRRPVRRDRPPLRSDDRRRQPARAPPTTPACSSSSRPGARSPGETPSGWWPRPRPAARAQVAASIEAYAASQAQRSGRPRPTASVATARRATPTARRTTGRGHRTRPTRYSGSSSPSQAHARVPFGSNWDR